MHLVYCVSLILSHQINACNSFPAPSDQHPRMGRLPRGHARHFFFAPHQFRSCLIVVTCLALAFPIPIRGCGRYRTTMGTIRRCNATVSLARSSTDPCFIHTYRRIRSRQTSQPVSQSATDQRGASQQQQPCSATPRQNMQVAKATTCVARRAIHTRTYTHVHTYISHGFSGPEPPAPIEPRGVLL